MSKTSIKQIKLDTLSEIVSFIIPDWFSSWNNSERDLAEQRLWASVGRVILTTLWPWVSRNRRMSWANTFFNDRGTSVQRIQAIFSKRETSEWSLRIHLKFWVVVKGISETDRATERTKFITCSIGLLIKKADRRLIAKLMTKVTWQFWGKRKRIVSSLTWKWVETNQRKILSSNWELELRAWPC